MQRKQVLIPSAIIALRSLKPNIYIFIHRFGKNMQANKQQQKLKETQKYLYKCQLNFCDNLHIASFKFIFGRFKKSSLLAPDRRSD